MNARQVLRVCAWNPNGIRSLMKDNPKEVSNLIDTHNPDIIVWNETKGNESKQLDAMKSINLVMPGWKWIWNDCQIPGRYGTAVSIKADLDYISVDFGFGDGNREHEGRIITVQFEYCYVVGIYAVNSGTKELKRLQYKIQWLERLLTYIESLKSSNPTKSVILIGDLNIAPKDIDIHDPKKNKNTAGFTTVEKEAFQIFVNRGWIDTFRFRNPGKVAYTYWNGKTKQGKKYGGWRIDHALVDFESLANVLDFQILDTYSGSDHCPILLTLKLGGIIKNPKLAFHMPTVVKLKRKEGEIVQGCDVHITRRVTMGGWNLSESIWHNPDHVHDDSDRLTVISRYESYIRSRILKEYHVFQPLMHSMITQGRSIQLGCFCKPEPCHGDVILKILSEYIEYLAQLELLR